jgi:hypothetical protein
LRQNSGVDGMLINGNDGTNGNNNGKVNLKNCTFDNFQMSGNMWGERKGAVINVINANVTINDSFFNNTFAFGSGGFFFSLERILINLCRCVLFFFGNSSHSTNFQLRFQLFEE